MNNAAFFSYLAVMAGVTYLIRMLPLAFIQKKIRSPFIRSFLYYVPYAVLSAMTIPDIFSSTGDWRTALCGFAAAVILALKGKSLLTVALLASLSALLARLIFI